MWSAELGISTCGSVSAGWLPLCRDRGRRRSCSSPLSPPALAGATARSRMRRPASLALGLVLLALAWPAGGGAGRAPDPPAGLRVSVLDVGQGDAILLQPASAPAVLVDGGPPGEELRRSCARPGSRGSVPRSSPTRSRTTRAGSASCSGRCRSGGPALRGARRRLTAAAAAEVGSGRAGWREAQSCAQAVCGSRSSGRPPSCSLDRPAGEDPNRLALVLLARWSRFSMLLTPMPRPRQFRIEPGPIDVLKVAHHGSEDAGLADLLERTRPRLAVISVGEGNPFGHPTPRDLAHFAAHGVRSLRTDRDGTVVIEVGRQVDRGRKQGLRWQEPPRTRQIDESILGFSPLWPCRLSGAGRWKYRCSPSVDRGWRKRRRG